MEKKSNSTKYAGASLLTAIAASLCCITPVLALVAGSSGIASSFSFLEPFRPYFIGITILVLAFAWYQKLKPTKPDEIDCDCETDEKPSFWQSRKFLLIITLFAILMMAFPYYSGAFHTEKEKEIIIVDINNIVEKTLDIEGMSCPACNNHIENAVNKGSGILEVSADYKSGKAIVKYDKSQTNIDSIIKNIDKTTYKVKK
ncbi:MAG: mercuric transport protein MerTP [Chlorobi bacterium]|nr:mercuric transport protein MerTP [Chlorobiota bacterium]